eukprot:gnl/TRDRNA2_/TRDRNA2_85074_c0_seq1.p1 gnl/TRDRNA2_/TRDRNA2_85074_c0~~gnl/TRDRNA2_/TRDRNA2_85074_c0_seq1.p1  ORF type:complete len:496 (+),score=106.56 gnl/TRDRNA2_/TRDRNA2_85074_c0_seq1:95-1582(+)
MSDDKSQHVPLLNSENADKKTRFFTVTAREGLMLREGPTSKARRTGAVLNCGEVFGVDDIVTKGLAGALRHWDSRPEEACALHLADGRGWVIDKHLITNEDLVERYDLNMTPLEKSQKRLRSVFQSTNYEYAIMTVITINAVFIGLEIDHPGIMSHLAWMIVNSIFAIIYVTEISVKMFAFGCKAFFMSNWNIFDLLVTVAAGVGDVLAIYAFVMESQHHEHNAAMSGVVSIVPVLRLLRLMRIANLFEELRLLMRALVGSVSSLGWIALITMLWFYICACLCTVLVGRKEFMSDKEVKGASELRKKFANIGVSMYTLWEVMILEGWTDVVRPLVVMRPFLVMFFFLFVFVTAFFLLNLVTAVVVDKTIAAKQESDEREENVEGDVREARAIELYNRILEHNGGKDLISFKGLVAFNKDPKVLELLELLEWKGNLESLWFLLDHNSKAEVSLQKLREILVIFALPLDHSSYYQLQVQQVRRMETVLAKLEKKGYK